MDNYEKLLKLLKDKKVDIIRVHLSVDCGLYNCYYINATELHLTDEEFKMIKEWLNE